VTIETTNKYGSIRRVGINQFFCGKFGVGPSFMVPIASGDPTPRWNLRRKLSNPFCEFLRRVCISKIDARELEASTKKMHVSIVKARQHQTLFRVNDPAVWSGELIAFA